MTDRTATYQDAGLRSAYSLARTVALQASPTELTAQLVQKVKSVEHVWTRIGSPHTLRLATAEYDAVREVMIERLTCAARSESGRVKA